MEMRFSSNSLRPLIAGAALVLLSISQAQPLRAEQPWAIFARPTTQDLNKLCFLDNQLGWVVGDGGTILMTADGGATWQAQVSPVTLDIVDIDMLDAQHGWALARRYPDGSPESGTRVLRTVNGGAEWVVQASFTEIFHALGFTDADHGCIGGEHGILLRTQDGGVNWSKAQIEHPETAMWPIRDFNFYSSTFGLATGGLYDASGIIWRTTDGGQSWTHDRVAGEPIFGTHFFDEENVLCVGGDLDWGSGMVSRSSETANWQYRFLGIWGEARAVSFRTASEGWAPLGFAGTYMYTHDAGTTWTAVSTPGGAAMNDVIFTDANTGYMVGSAGTILKYVQTATSVGDPVVGLPASLSLRVTTPVTGNGAVPIRYSLLGRTSNASIRIYSVDGRLMESLGGIDLTEGTHSIEWDGRDDRGRAFASGVYVVQLNANGQQAAAKVVIAR